MTGNLEFRLVSNSDYQATLVRWREEAEAADLFPNEAENLLSWIPDALEKNQKEDFAKQLAYGIFKPENCSADAICELVLTDKGNAGGRWLKLLKVTLSPKIFNSIENEDAEGINAAVEIFRTAVLGSFSERLTHEADTLKLYGRTDGLMQFLLVLMTTIHNQDTILKARKDGRWLVIESGTKP